MTPPILPRTLAERQADLDAIRAMRPPGLAELANLEGLERLMREAEETTRREEEQMRYNLAHTKETPK